MFRVGLSGQMFDDRSVWEHLEAAADIGYESVELRSAHVNPSVPQKELEQIRLFLEKHGIQVNALSCFTGNYGLLSDAECEKAFDVFKEYVALADYFGADMVRVWPAWQASAEAPARVWEKAALWTKKSGEYAAEQGKKIVIETHHGTLCDTVDSCLRFMDMVDCAAAGLTFDPVNIFQVPAEYTGEAVSKLGRYIKNVHIKDIAELSTSCNPYCFAYSYYAKHIGRFTEVKFTPPRTERYYVHRRIGQGGVDWDGVLSALRDVGYTSRLIVESVSEGNRYMPCGRRLAACCYEDVRTLQKKLAPADEWHRVSPKARGFYTVFTPGDGVTQVAGLDRLNLAAGESHTLCTGDREINGLLVAGAATIERNGVSDELKKLDSFYMPGKTTLKLTAKSDTVMYIGSAPCEGFGKPFIRRFDRSLPLGDIHQIHGGGAGEREVMFTVDPNTPASRLICGITWSRDGGWTSWPPHQHEKDLEEIYCYFDMKENRNGLHLSYNTDESFSSAAVSILQDGSMVAAPAGYHPTVAVPGSKNVYFWVLAAHSHESRRYDLAKTDPQYMEG